MSSSQIGAPFPNVASEVVQAEGVRREAANGGRGGMAVIPQDIPTDVVAEVVAWVKSRHTVFETPTTLTPTDTTGVALAVIPKRSHGAAIVTDGGVPVGVVTEGDCSQADRFAQVHQVMSREVFTPHKGMQGLPVE